MFHLRDFFNSKQIFIAAKCENDVRSSIYVCYVYVWDGTGIYRYVNVRQQLVLFLLISDPPQLQTFFNC